MTQISDIGNEDFLLSCMETYCGLDGNLLWTACKLTLDWTETYCGLNGNLMWIGWKLTVDWMGTYCELNGNLLWITLNYHR